MFKTLLTTDAFGVRCYQLAQSFLKIGSALAERVGYGKVGGSTAVPDSAWWRLQLSVQKALVNDRWAVCLLSCTCPEICRDRKDIHAVFVSYVNVIKYIVVTL